MASWQSPGTHSPGALHLTCQVVSPGHSSRCHDPHDPHLQNPDTPCMAYLPTLGWCVWGVNCSPMAVPWVVSGKEEESSDRNTLGSTHQTPTPRLDSTISSLGPAAGPTAAADSPWPALGRPSAPRPGRPGRCHSPVPRPSGLHGRPKRGHGAVSCAA